MTVENLKFWILDFDLWIFLWSPRQEPRRSDFVTLRGRSNLIFRRGWYPQEELNLYPGFRKPVLYPLSYGGLLEFQSP